MILNSIADNFEHVSGIDLAKNFFQVYEMHGNVKKTSNIKLQRNKVILHFSNKPNSLIFIEKCGGSDFWARQLEKLGHTVKMIAPQHVKKYLNHPGQKTDHHDAEAIARCGMQPNTKFIKIKTPEQQSINALHTIRQDIISRRVAISNQIRGHLTEFGIVAPKGIKSFKEELPKLMAKCEELCDSDLLDAIHDLQEEFRNCEEKEEKYTKIIRQKSSKDELCKLAESVPGVGELTASAVVAAVGNAKQFESSKEMSAWVGLVPREHSSGGHQRSGKITKHGDPYIRRNLILGAQSIVRTCTFIEENRKTQLHKFAQKLLTKGKLHNQVVAAVAHKMIRVLWAVLTTNKKFKSDVDPNKGASSSHVPELDL